MHIEPFLSRIQRNTSSSCTVHSKHTFLRIPQNNKTKVIITPAGHRGKGNVWIVASFTFLQVTVQFWVLSELTNICIKRQTPSPSTQHLLRPAQPGWYFGLFVLLRPFQAALAPVGCAGTRSQGSIQILFAPLFPHQPLWKEHLGTATNMSKACVKRCWQTHSQSTKLPCGSCSPTPLPLRGGHGFPSQQLAGKAIPKVIALTPLCHLPRCPCQPHTPPHVPAPKTNPTALTCKLHCRQLGKKSTLNNQVSNQ